MRQLSIVYGLGAGWGIVKNFQKFSRLNIQEKSVFCAVVKSARQFGHANANLNHDHYSFL